MKQPEPVQRQTSLPTTMSGGTTKTMTAEVHYKDWPNAAGFNVTTEVRSPINLPVSGKIPSFVAGSLYRTGPAAYKTPRAKSKDGEFAMQHWFDGFTTIHRFDLIAGEDGHCQQAQYSSRSQVDKMIEHAQKTGNFSGISFAQKRDPCDSFYRKIKTTFDPAPYENIGVAIRDSQPGEIAAIKKNGINVSGKNFLTVTSDLANVSVMDADTLEPLGIVDQKGLHPSLEGPLAAAHPETDPVNGDVFNYNLNFGAGGPTYRIFRASPSTGKTDVLATVRGLEGSYIHSLFLTENFVVLCVWSAYFRMKGISILLEHNLLDAIAPFNPKSQVTWLVVDRRGNRGLVQKFTSPAFFCFHTINAFETPSSDGTGNVDITCDLYEFETMDIIHNFYYERLVSNSPKARGSAGDYPSGLARYKLSTIPLAGAASSFFAKSKAAEKVLYIPAPAAGDLCRINPRFHTKEHRYVWGIVNRGKSTFLDALVKTDTKSQSCVYWECDKHTPSEPMFIPTPGGVEEDDGVILSVILNGETSQSYLLCLDARTLQETGRVEIGRAVPFGLHGKHIGAKQ